MIGDRIKEIRQSAGLTQTAFSARIGIKQPSLNAIERGDNKPSDQTIFIICKEFRVNEEWLRTGEGDPVVPSPSSVVDQFAEQYHLCPEATAMISKFVVLDPTTQKAVFAYMCAVVDQIRGTEDEPTREDWMRAEFERQLDKEKEDAAQSEV